MLWRVSEFLNCEKLLLKLFLWQSSKYFRTGKTFPQTLSMLLHSSDGFQIGEKFYKRSFHVVAFYRKFSNCSFLLKIMWHEPIPTFSETSQAFG